MGGLRIERASVWPATMPLSQPYSVAYERFEAAENVFVRLDTNQGLIGMGCAAPDPVVTGEDQDQTVQALTVVAEPLLAGADLDDWAVILEQLKRRLPGAPSAWCAVDMALADLTARAAGRPLYRLLGSQRHKVATFVTIGLAAEEETLAEARKRLAEGFRALKVKGGRDVNEDIERAVLLREAVGPGVELAWDANQGYTIDEARWFIRQASPASLAFLEQPTAQPAFDDLAAVKAESPLPIMADESLTSAADAFALARNNAVDLFNIKLTKVGGLREAAAIQAVASAAGIRVMIGCMDEAALGIAAGLHFALACPQLAYADLDGHLDLIDDPTAGCVGLENGVLHPSNKPGLGVDPF
jgi:L-alanine-DL-glutamate epimerase-like enolase superfamily enzyme